MRCDSKSLRKEVVEEASKIGSSKLYQVATVRETKFCEKLYSFNSNHMVKKICSEATGIGAQSSRNRYYISAYIIFVITSASIVGYACNAEM